MNDFLKELAKDCGFNPDNKDKGLCVKCNEPFSDKNTFSAAGWRETQISGMCEKCFDNVV